MNSGKSFRIAPFITLYSFAHLAVDASCAFLLLGILELKSHAILSMLLYNGIAFVMQAPIGYIIDKALNPKTAAILGLFFVAIAYLFWDSLFITLIIISFGNALFHVGGGSLVLSLENRKTTFSGIYVAPGGIGLALGSFLALSPVGVNSLFFPVALIILGILLCFTGTPEFSRAKSERKNNPDYKILIIILIMIPVAIRSLLSLSAEFPWKENQFLYLLLIAAVALGKVSGGILADKFGLMKIGVGGLLFSMPFLAFFPSIPALGILGAFIFNFTMPITLVAMLNAMPQNRGLSFGLTTAALFIGSLPVILNKNGWIKNEWMIFLFIFLAAAILFIALRLIDRYKPSTT